MNKIINILLFSALVIGSIGLITYDVWADDIAIFQVMVRLKLLPLIMVVRLMLTFLFRDLVMFLIIINIEHILYSLVTLRRYQWCKNTSYYFDWTIWYPEQYDIVPCLSRGSHKVGGGWYYTLSSSFYLYNPNTYNYTSIHVTNGMPGDKYTYSCSIDGNDVKIYSYVNESFESTTFKSLKKMKYLIIQIL